MTDSEEPAVDAGPHPELAEVVDAQMPSTELVVRDPADEQHVMVVLDNHDVEMLLRDIQQVAMRSWVYELDGGKLGLTVHAVQDITQRMNWTGKCQIGLVPETLVTEVITADEGNGPEPFWVATIFAVDKKTGQMQAGSSMEPQMMKLRQETADKRRRYGAKIPEDNKVFDRFTRTKAIQKAQRNAQSAFIPEVIEQTVIAMFGGDSSRVEKIQTAAEQKVAELPPALTDTKALELMSEAEAIYDQIRELRGGQGAIKMPSGQFAAWRINSQHSHDALSRMIDYLKQRLEELPAEIDRDALERKAADTVNDVACPNCGAERKKFCKGIKGAHRERYVARVEQLEASA